MFALVFSTLFANFMTPGNVPQHLPGDGTPRIHLSVDKLDFGRVVSGESREETVQISNQGNTELLISRIGVNCACASLRLSTTTQLNVPIDSKDEGRTDLKLSAGESATLRFIVDTARLKAGALSKRCLIFSNDPVNSPVSIPLSMEVTQPLRKTAPQGEPAEGDPHDHEPHLTNLPPKATSEPLGPPSRIEASEYEHAFGQVYSGEIILHDFALKNTGEGPLKIDRVMGSCACAPPQMTIGQKVYDQKALERGLLEDAILNPGEEATLQVKFMPAAAGLTKSETKIRKFVRVYSNDITRNPLQLTIDADLVQSLMFEPRELRLGAVQRRLSSVLTATFWSDHIGPFAVAKVSSKDEKRLLASAKQVGERGDSPVYELEVTVQPDCPPGNHRVDVVLDVVHDRVKQVLVPVEWEVSPDVHFLDNSELKDLLDFGTMDGSKDEVLELRIKNAYGEIPYIPKSVQINARPSSEPFSHELVEVTPGIEYVIKVKVSKDIQPKFFQGTLIIQSDHPEAPAKAVRFKGFVDRK